MKSRLFALALAASAILALTACEALQEEFEESNRSAPTSSHEGSKAPSQVHVFDVEVDGREVTCISAAHQGGGSPGLSCDWESAKEETDDTDED
ncbi:hypothetical protein [Nocardiopsis sp. NPDC006938]|uniref:hypothetical protein n=1 Tax=Nocardiopsis sp. NPDC006938 TaxID=3364337 RepID=UPI0036A10D8A